MIRALFCLCLAVGIFALGYGVGAQLATPHEVPRVPITCRFDLHDRDGQLTRQWFGTEDEICPPGAARCTQLQRRQHLTVLQNGQFLTVQCP